MSFRIVDSRGRLFGKINLIDLAVLIGLLLIGLEGYGFLFEKRNVPVRVREESRTVLVTIEIPNKPLWFSRAITVGDRETDEKNFPIGIILEKETSPVTSLTWRPGGKSLLIKNPSREDIFLKLELRAIVVKGDLLFKNAKLKIGNRLVLETKTILLEGVITHVQLDKAIS
jgi:hypothetical protein